MAIHATTDLSAATDVTLALNRLWSAEPGDVRSFWRHVERHPAGAAIRGLLRGGSRQAVVLHGWGCEMCILPDGRRQIFSLALPGDLVTLPREADISVRTFVALTPLDLMDPRLVPGGEEGEEEEASHVRLKSREETEERLFAHMMRLGQLNGYERVLHLFLELHERLSAVGLATGGTFRLPLTQEVLGDVLGLSIVHFNRTLQQLRRDGLITVKGRMLTLHRLNQIAALALYRNRASEPPARPC